LRYSNLDFFHAISKFMDKSNRTRRSNHDLIIPSYHEDFDEEKRQGWVTMMLVKSAYEKGFKEGTSRKAEQLNKIIIGSLATNLILFFFVWVLIFFL